MVTIKLVHVMVACYGLTGSGENNRKPMMTGEVETM